jgi:hypothetical protein
VDVHQLIKHNFKTNDPKKVNWYLRTVVGCNTPSRTRWNWTFKGAKPGVIYIPINVSPPPQRPEPEGRNALARWLDNLPEVDEEFDWGKVSFALNLVEFAHVVAAVFPAAVLESEGALAFLGLGIEVTGPIAGFVAFWIEIGSAYKEAIDYIKRNLALRGMSLGIVLGANGARNSYIKEEFVDVVNIRDPQFPEQNANFEKIEKGSIWAGVAYGRQLNRTERGKLFKILHEKMGWNFDENTKPWDQWNDHDKREYYKDAAAAFRAKFIRR